MKIETKYDVGQEVLIKGILKATIDDIEWHARRGVVYSLIIPDICKLHEDDISEVKKDIKSKLKVGDSFWYPYSFLQGGTQGVIKDTLVEVRNHRYNWKTAFDNGRRWRYIDKVYPTKEACEQAIKEMEDV